MVRFYWVEKTSQSSIMSEKIDVGKVEKELVAALAADRKYERENDAKLRAVTQRVATYEEFRFKSGRGSAVQRVVVAVATCPYIPHREIVKGSHLRALDQKDMKGGAYRQPWNIALHGEREGEKEEGEQPDRLGEECTPCNVQTFTREWRRLKQQPNGQYR